MSLMRPVLRLNEVIIHLLGSLDLFLFSSDILHLYSTIIWCYMVTIYQVLEPPDSINAKFLTVWLLWMCVHFSRFYLIIIIIIFI